MAFSLSPTLFAAENAEKAAPDPAPIAANPPSNDGATPGAPVDLVWPAPPAQTTAPDTPDTARDLLFRMSASADPRTRAAAVEGLAALDSDRALKIVVAGLADPAPEVRSAAASAIAKAPEDKLFDGIMAILEQGPSAETRELAATLGRMSEKFVPQLTSVLKSEDSSLDRKCAAAFALGQMRSNASAELLTELTWVSEPELAVTSAEALASLMDPAAAEELERILLQHQNPNARWAALQGLGKLGGPVAIRALSQLVTGKRERTTAIRQEAVAILGVIGGPAIVPVLVESMQRDVNVSHQAGAALRRLTGETEIRDEPTSWQVWLMEMQQAQAAAQQPPPLVPSTGAAPAPSAPKPAK